MVLLKEYRVILPVSVDEYQVGQLYSVAEASKNETGGGEGVEVLVNEPYEKDGERGQYTHKIYHLQSKVPTFVRMLAPEGALNIHEKAWNAYPYCRTVITNEYMKEDFLIKIETWHKPDLGTQENVHKLEPEAWKHVEAIYIDIADRSQVLSKDYKAEEDPAKFKSIKTGRGPLGPNWKVQFTPSPPGGRALWVGVHPAQEGNAWGWAKGESEAALLVTCLPVGVFLIQQELVNQKDCPYMCAYKLVTVKFKWWGLQNKVENFIHKQEKRLFTNFHRQLFCWLDKWVDLTMDDIRRMEEETKRQLDEMRQKDPVKGMTADD
uniref:Phosphatidylinositol transfer protein alpha isoform n=1 Tax=Equus caballus TaxID=9796 RepID=A0A9L0R7J4_HORSE